MWSAVNVLPNSPKISDLTQRPDSLIIPNYIKSAAVQIWAVFGTPGHVASRKVFKNRSFRVFK